MHYDSSSRMPDLLLSFMAAAWIIEWRLHRKDSPVPASRPHILPRHWQSARVLDYMRCLYWNSPLWTPTESLAHVNQRKPQGIFIGDYGPRLFYGDATHLDAVLVKDLHIERRSSGEMILEWTAPPGIRFNRNTWKIEPMGES